MSGLNAKARGMAQGGRQDKTMVRQKAPGGRITLTTAVPVTTSDVTAATSFYYTPYLSNIIPLYNGNEWKCFEFNETKLTPTLAASKIYDVFAEPGGSGNTIKLSLSAAWTSDTARADSLEQFDGVWVLKRARWKRFLGTIRTTSGSQLEDSLTRRLVWNWYNRELRALRRAETTATWTYNGATFQQANAAAANQVEIVTGMASCLDLTLIAMGTHTAANATQISTIGEDSTTAVATESLYWDFHTEAAAGRKGSCTHLVKFPSVGYHYYAWIERATSGATTTFHGVTADARKSGLAGTILG